MKHRIIARENEKYLSFPSVAKMHCGRLILVYREAGKFSHKAARDGKTTHHDPNSQIMAVFSDDQGVTWSEPVVAYKSDLGVNDPAVTVLTDGTILLRFVGLEIVETREANKFFNQPIFSHRVEHGLVSTVVGNFVYGSKDGGCTWEKLCVSDPKEIIGGCSRDPILELPDGSLLMSVYTGSPARSEIAWVIRSYDRGLSWSHPAIIMKDNNGKSSQQRGINYSETSMAHLGDGHILALTRADQNFFTEQNEYVQVGGLGELKCSESYDAGLSWTHSWDSGIYGTPGALLQLSDKRLLATFGYRLNPFGVRCRFSEDGGRSWPKSSEVILRDDAPVWDCGYPFSIQLNENEIFTVYYLPDSEGNRHIAGTHWRLGP